jgi:hypothetical protein
MNITFPSGAGVASITKPTLQPTSTAAGVFTGSIKFNVVSN